MSSSSSDESSNNLQIFNKRKRDYCNDERINTKKSHQEGNDVKIIDQDELLTYSTCKKDSEECSDRENGCNGEVTDKETNKEPPKSDLLMLPDVDGLVEYETAFKNRLRSYFIKDKNCLDLTTFLKSVESKVVEKIREMLHEFRSLKINLSVDCNMINLVGEELDASFKTSNEAIFQGSDIFEILSRHFLKLTNELEESQLRKSGWSFKNADGLRLKINKNNPLRAGSYLPLPKNISSKKSCINVKNNDNKCFKYAILSKFVKINPQNVSKYNSYSLNHRYNFTNVSFPTPLNEIDRFSRENNISINIFGLTENNEVFPLKIVDKELEDRRDLLLLRENEKMHYCYISNFERLVNKQISKHDGQKFICKKCFSYYDQRYNGEEKFTEHKRLCNKHCPTRFEASKKDFIEFSKVERTQTVPFVAYCDFEAILKPTAARETLNEVTTAISHHVPMSFGVYVVANDNVKTLTNTNFEVPYLYRGKYAAKRCIEYLIKVATEVYEVYSRNVPMIMTKENVESHRKSTICYLCDKPFGIDNEKVHDHCHYTGRYRGAAHNSCNLKFKSPMFLPVFVHNLAGYDSHFLINELGYDDKRIDIIPNSTEKYITFSKYINNKMSIRFIDTMKFIPASIENLAKTLVTFDHMEKFYDAEKLKLVTRKGIFPYEYVDSWEKLDEKKLPPQEQFFSSLNGSNISDEDYAFAQKIWNEFECITIGDYSDEYLKIDVLLLADIFERFRSTIHGSHKLDPAHYYTLPGLTWDAMLRHTGVKLDTVKDYDMVLMLENGIRGGICQVSHRFSEANNHKLKDYNPEEEESYITYQDCNNLYGLAMTLPLPMSDFSWEKSPENLKMEKMTENDDFGYFLEVDVEYPATLHESHNDLPFLPETIVINKNKKLITHFNSRKKYVVHYLALKQALTHGLQLIKINRAIKFKQCKWMASYIHLNNNLRKISTSEFEKDMYKLFNNAIFGKTMENVRKRLNLKLVSNAKQLEKYIARSDFIDRTIYNENLACIHLRKSKLIFDKPIYVGLAVLDLSKIVMYSYHYDVMLPKFGMENLRLLYTDTDSFIYKIITHDLYKDLLTIIDHLDTSDLPVDHECYSSKNKKVLGKFKDETKGKLIKGFVGLRAKMYSIKFEDDETIKKAKGIKKSAVDKALSYNDYVEVVLNESCMKTSMYNIQSKNHELFTFKINKKSLCANDDKRIIKSDGISTIAHGSSLLPAQV